MSNVAEESNSYGGSQPAIHRRGLLAGAAGLGVALSAGSSLAQESQKIVAEEYWADKGSTKLYIYRKHLADSAVKRPVIMLMHGSTFSGRGGFDLQVPGHEDYSLMDFLAGLGFDVWTMDNEGFGRSTRPDKYLGIESGVADTEIGFGVIEKITGEKAPMVCGQSSGAIRAALFAAKHPERVERLVLDAFTYTGKGAPEIDSRRKRAPELQKSFTRKLDRKTFHGIFTRDDPSTYVPAMADALADYELKLGDTAPSGSYLDMALHLPFSEPEQVKCPICIIRADTDGNATDAELYDYFARLPNRDKQFHMVRGVAHVSVLGINRHRVWHIMREFFTYPSLRNA